MTETREFPTAVIASISTGILLCEFDKMHEAAEYIMGHPIWTHHFGDRILMRAMRRKIREQWPGCPIAMSNVTRNNYQKRVADLEREHGKTVIIRKGDGATAKHPLDGIPAGTPTIII